MKSPLIKTHLQLSPDYIALPASFPILVSQTEGVSPTFQRLHWHSAFEINYIVKGSGHVLINGTRHDFHQGDIVLINSNDLHRAFENEGLVMQIIMFDGGYFATEQRYDTDLLQPFRELGQRFDHVLPGSHPMVPGFGEMLLDLEREYKTKEPHYEAIVRSQFIRLFAYINRYFAKKGGAAALRTRGVEPIRQSLRAIEADIAYSWTLGKLAEMAHLSPSRYSALFVQTVGTSPMDYLIQLRLSKAVSLIETTDSKIIQIAADCGFRNLSNFNRLFKLHIGKLPSELRQSEKQ
ncbi:AraC family transcriptional regulator [Paenibacillus sp. NPDC058071]|uniref:helix-turn-helix transcriptional regulator n=1 Tax=Paenibacillus sp. NPDC058071 TaxID=3346326 RepID=UPI0036DD733F